MPVTKNNNNNSTTSVQDDELLLPNERDIIESIQDTNEIQVQQYMVRIIETILQIDSSSQQQQQDVIDLTQQSCLQLLLTALRKDHEQETDNDLSKLNFFVTDCFVDSLWLCTSWMENPLSGSSPSTSSATTPNESLVFVLRALLNQLFDVSSLSSSPVDNNGIDQPKLGIIITKHKEYMLGKILESCSDIQLLQSIQLIVSANEMQKKLRTTNTTINYRQYKFNLLVEESEGYSKLCYYLLFTTSKSSISNGLNNPELMIGYFISTYSLDPNRCLDLCIDVFEYEIMMLRKNQQKVILLPVPISENNVRIRFLYDCITICNRTGKLPQLLGFKLKGRFGIETTQNKQPTLQQGNDDTSTKGTSTDRTVSTLLYCMSYLSTSVSATVPTIQNGHRTDNSKVQLLSSDTSVELLNSNEMIYYMPDNDVQAFLSLLDDTYEKIYKVEKDRIKNAGRIRLSSGTSNDTTANNTTESTTTSTSASTTTDATTGSSLLQPLQNQLIIQWLHVLLEVVQPNGFEHIQKIIVFQDYWSKLAYLFPTTIGVAICDYVQNHIAKFTSKLTTIETDGLTTKSEEEELVVQSSDNKLEISLDDVLDTISDPLDDTYEAGCIVYRPILYSQICRLLSSLMNYEIESKQIEIGTKNYGKVIEFLRYYLLPSLSLFISNSAISMELWNVLKLLPYRVRYSLYKSWRGIGLERTALQQTSNTTNYKPLWLIESEIKLGIDARYSLKRLSKDTIRDMSRAVAKCCHSHPLVVFTTILLQIESYDNLVQVMVDSCRYVTPLSLDVLGYCILQRLIGESNTATSASSTMNRNRLKENGVNVSQWLQSLESFTGAFYKRFPYIECQGVLYYLIQRIKDGYVTELGMLRTLLKSSGGWGFADYSPAASLSGSQLEGRAGSTVLKRETMFFGVVEDINIYASNVVRNVLQNDTIGVSLLILLAQVRNKIVYDVTATSTSSTQQKPVKLIGNLVDTCQVVMSILLDFLTNSISDDNTRNDDNDESRIPYEVIQYAQALPSLVELLEVYKLDVASAWMLCRPLVRATSKFLDDEPILKGGELAVASFKPTDESRLAYQKLFTEKTWSNLTVELFETFYASTLYDLCCPEDLYIAEMQRLEKDIDRLSRHKSSAMVQQQVSIQPGNAPEKSDKEEIERMKKVLETLQEDLTTQKEHVRLFRDTIKRTIDVLFANGTSCADKAMTFLHRCIYPRCLQSPDDALYCIRFVQLLHDNETTGFSTLHFLDAMVIILSRSMFCLTEGEAACVSIMLSESWKMLSRWRYDDNAFEQELLQKPGSFMVVSTDGESNTVTTEPVTKDDYNNLYNKWHADVGAACLGCLQSTEYMHIRNSLVVLTRMVDYYPTRPRIANKLLEALEPLKDESNTFADIRASAQAYGMQLVKARDDGVWKEEDAATVKARLEKEQAAAEQRHRKAEEKMAEIKRDQDQITEEFGGTRDRGRDRIRGGLSYSSGGGGGGGPGNKSYDVSGGRGRDERREHDERRNEERRRADERRATSTLPQNDRWVRERPQTGGGTYATIVSSSVSGTTASSRRDETSGRGLEGRWQYAGDQQQQQQQQSQSQQQQQQPSTISGTKRSRPSSPTNEPPEPRGDTQAPSKRLRTTTETVASSTGEETGTRSDEASRSRRQASSRRGRHGGRR